MSIHPDMEAWKRRFGICLFGTLGILMLTGAKEVTYEWRRHHEHLADVNRQVWHWIDGGRAIDPQAPPPVTQVPLPRTKDRNNAPTPAEHGLFLLRACARPAPGHWR